MATVTSLAFCLCTLAVLYEGVAGNRCPSNLNPGPHVVEFADTGSCYEFVTTHTMDWSHANDDCRKKGGMLAEIDSIVEENWIMTQLRTLQFGGTGVWIGLSDSKVEGTFMWSSGRSPSFTFWGQRQGPDAGILHFAHEVEDCVILKYSDNGHWHDYPCRNIGPILENFGYICQYQMLSTTTATASVVVG